MTEPLVPWREAEALLKRHKLSRTDKNDFGEWWGRDHSSPIFVQRDRGSGDVPVSHFAHIAGELERLKNLLN